MIATLPDRQPVPLCQVHLFGVPVHVSGYERASALAAAYNHMAILRAVCTRDPRSLAIVGRA